MTGMARLLQFQSAVLHSDSQTRLTVPDSGHQLPAAYGCGTAMQVPRLPQCGRHRLPALHEGGSTCLQSATEAPRCLCQHYNSVAAINCLQSTTEAPTASISMLWPRDANQDPSRELQPAPLPAFPCCGQGMPTKIPPRSGSSYASCSYSGRCHQFQTVAPRAPLCSTRCLCHDYDSVAAITTMSSIQLYKALPAGEEEGRKEINTPNQVFVLQPAVPPPLPYGHISTCSVRDPTSYITS